jgi:hypothetical protein
MNNFKNITNVLADFYKKNNLKPINAEHKQDVEFYIDGKKIKCSQQGDALIIESVISRLPEDKTESEVVLEKLLQLSFLNSDTFGFTVALNDEDELILTNKQLLLNSGLLQLEETLEEFVFQVESYERVVQETANSASKLIFGMLPVA